VRDLSYTSSGKSARNAYRGLGELVLRPGASLPEICVGCGDRSWGNVIRKEYSKPAPLMYLPPFGIDLLFGLVFGKQFLFDFPFCSKCAPDGFGLKLIRLNGYFAVFGGGPRRFLELLLPVPEARITEMSLNWIGRNLRRFWN
jgi:hypothetical protein